MRIVPSGRRAVGPLLALGRALPSGGVTTPVRTRAGRPYGRRLFSNACRVCIYYQFLSSVSIGQRRLGGRPAGARRREAREGRRAPSASPVRPDRGARGGRRAGARSEGLRAAGLLPRRTSTEVSRQLKPYRQLPRRRTPSLSYIHAEPWQHAPRVRSPPFVTAHAGPRTARGSALLADMSSS